MERYRDEILLRLWDAAGVEPGTQDFDAWLNGQSLMRIDFEDGRTTFLWIPLYGDTEFQCLDQVH